MRIDRRGRRITAALALTLALPLLGERARTGDRENSAEQRVATLLLGISARNSQRRLSATAFRLAMSRSDIGNYLGLTVETVSRVFSRFQKLGILGVDNKEIAILDAALLREAASGGLGGE